MPFYTYETIPAHPDAPVRRYELWQGIKNAPFDRHPETGEPLRRVFPGMRDERRGRVPRIPALLIHPTFANMNQSSQDRYRPIIERRLATVESRLAEIVPHAISTSSVVIEFPRGQEMIAPTAPETKSLLDERLRLQLALQRIEGCYFGRCIRCGRDLPLAHLDREPDALTCGTDCRPRRR